MAANDEQHEGAGESLTLQTPTGMKWWTFERSPNGARLTNSSGHKPATWALSAADQWANAVARANISMAPRSDAMAALQTTWDHLGDVLWQALRQGVPGARQKLQKLQQQLARWAEQDGVPYDLRAHLQARAQTLEQALRKTQPAVSVRDDGPTPEALAQHERGHSDDIQALLADNLDEAQLSAAQEVQAIHHALTEKLVPGEQRLDKVEGAKKGAGRRADPGEDMPPALAHQYATVYAPWRSDLTPTQRGVCQAVLVDGASPGHADRRYGLAAGEALQTLRRALSDYARRAGYKKARQD